jgi:CheY-like chemotaxis protein
LVEMHGGSIQATSPGLGQGSEFVVSLPLLKQPALPAPANANSPTATATFPTYRFLVVDDNESASHLLSKLLAKLGQDVRIAHSAETAIALASQWQPQVLISDIAMPEVSGYELAERLCGLSNIPRPMLIALTGYGQESDRQAALAAGFDEHLTKPIGMPTLQELLERVTKRMNSLPAAS